MNSKRMSYAIPKSYAIKHCRKRPKKKEEVLQRSFRNTSRPLMLADTFALKEVAE